MIPSVLAGLQGSKKVGPLLWEQDVGGSNPLAPTINKKI